MKLIIPFWLLTASVIYAAGPESNESLILSLADRDFKIRDAATVELKKRPLAFNAVRQAKESSNPEVAQRASEILQVLAKTVAAERTPQLNHFSRENQIDCFMEALISYPDRESTILWQMLLDHGHRTIDHAILTWKLDLRVASHVIPERQYKDLGRKNQLTMVFEPEKISDVPGKVLYRGPSCKFDRTGQTLLTVCSGDLETPSVEGFAYTLGNQKFLSEKDSDDDTYRTFAYGVSICDGDVIFSNEQLPKGARDDRSAGPAIIVARGNVVMPPACTVCVVLAGGTVTFSENCHIGGVVRCGGKAIYNGKLHKHSNLDIVENDPKALEPFKFFDVGMLGLTAIPRTDKSLEVAEVDAKSDLAKAGLAKGDVLLQIDGKPAKSTDELRKLLRSGYVRGEAKLTIRRGTNTKELCAIFPLPTK